MRPHHPPRPPGEPWLAPPSPGPAGAPGWTPRGSVVYGRSRQRDWLLTGSAAFLVVAVLVGGAFAWYGWSAGPVTRAAAGPERTAAQPVPAESAVPTGSADPAAPATSVPPSPTTSPTPRGDQAPTAPTALRNANSSLCLQLADQSQTDGAALQQAPCADTPLQRWTVVSAGGDAYALANAASGRCLDLSLEHGPNQEGAAVYQWSCTGAANQQWRLARSGNGAFQLISVASGKCLDVTGGSADPGAQPIQWTCHGGASQQWSVAG